MGSAGSATKGTSLRIFKSQYYFCNLICLIADYLFTIMVSSYMDSLRHQVHPKVPIQIHYCSYSGSYSNCIVTIFRRRTFNSTLVNVKLLRTPRRKFTQLQWLSDAEDSYKWNEMLARVQKYKQEYKFSGKHNF